MILFLLATVASAGLPVDLPDGQDPAVWSDALDLADLELVRSGERLVVHAEGQDWVVRWSAADGLRELRVPVPRTVEDREAFAFMARAFARELALNRDPNDLGALPVPPPPTVPPPPVPSVPARPPPPTVSPAPRPPVPRPRPPRPPVEPVPEPQEAAEPEPVLPTVALAELPPVAEVTFPEPVAPTRTPLRERWWYAPVQHPPLSLAVGPGARASMAGVWLTAAVRGLQTPRVSLDLQLLVGGPRAFRLPGTTDLWRWESQVGLDLVGGLRVTPELSVQLQGGLAQRSYRQQANPVDARLRPVGGFALEVDPLPDWRLRPFLRLVVCYDLVRTELVDERGVKSTLPPEQFAALVGMRLATRRWRDRKMFATQ